MTVNKTAPLATELKDKVSVCIVNWNTRDYLYDCIRSLEELNIANLEIIVVDNCSSDESSAMVKKFFPNIRFIQNTVNSGYARGNNQALSYAGGKYILFLNPDTVIPYNIFDKLIEKMESDSSIGVLTCQLRNPDRSIQNFCSGLANIKDEIFLQSGFDKNYPDNLWAGHKKMSFFSCDVESEIEQPPGTFIFTKREVLDRIGGFDENFPIFYNDVDWCARVSKAGWKIIFTPSVYIIHHKSASIKTNFEICLIEEFYMRRNYYKKHYGGFAEYMLSFFAPFPYRRETESGDYIQFKGRKRILVLKTTYDKHFQWFISQVSDRFPDSEIDVVVAKFDDVKNLLGTNRFRRVFPYISDKQYISYFKADKSLRRKLKRCAYDAILFAHPTVDGAGCWNLLFFGSLLSPKLIGAFGIDGRWNFLGPFGLRQIRGLAVYLSAYILLLIGYGIGFLNNLRAR